MLSLNSVFFFFNKRYLHPKRDLTFVKEMFVLLNLPKSYEVNKHNMKKCKRYLCLQLVEKKKFELQRQKLLSWTNLAVTVTRQKEWLKKNKKGQTLNIWKSFIKHPCFIHCKPYVHFLNKAQDWFNGFKRGEKKGKNETNVASEVTSIRQCCLMI